MVTVCTDIDFYGMKFHCPGFRFVPKAFVGFIRHFSPVPFSKECIKFFFGNTVGWYDINRELFQIEFPLTSGFLLSYRDDLISFRLGCGIIIHGIRFIEERHLAFDNTQLFGVLTKTVTVCKAHLFNQLLNVVIQRIELALHHEHYGNKFLAA